MKELKKLLKLDRDNYFETHLSIVNCLLPTKMTPMEIKVIAAFMALEGDIAQYRFGPSAKKIVREKLKISPAGLSNYMTQLLDKGFLIKTGDMTKIFPILIPEDEEQLYMLKLQNVQT